MKSGLYVIAAQAHQVIVNGHAVTGCGVRVTALDLHTPYDRRTHLGVAWICEGCRESMRPAVAKAEVPVEKCTCYACAESSVRRAAKAEGA